MPQLIPAPWLAYLLASWIVFLMTIPPKVSAYIFSKNPLSQSKRKPQMQPWHWPWY